MSDGTSPSGADRLAALDRELAMLREHARALTTAIGEFRHGLRRNAEARERNPDHQLAREQRRLRANCAQCESELETVRSRIEALQRERERRAAEHGNGG